MWRVVTTYVAAGAAPGRLGEPSEVLSTMVGGISRIPQLALRFVLANPNVSQALSGMSTMEQVEENIATASKDVALSEEEMATIDEHMERLKKMADLYCTGCKYCMPCPHEVNIPSIFNKYNQARVYGIWGSARGGYKNIGKLPWEKGKDATACEECAECEEKCPQDIPIIKQLKEAHEALTAKED